MECYGSCRIGVSVGMWCRRILTEPRRVRFVHWLQVDWDIWDGRPMAGCCWHYLRKPPWVPPQVPIKELSGSGFQMREVRTGHTGKSSKISKSGIDLFLCGLGETLRLSADFTSSTHWLIHLQLCNCQGRQTVHSLKANYTDAMVADKKVVGIVSCLLSAGLSAPADLHFHGMKSRDSLFIDFSLAA